MRRPGSQFRIRSLPTSSTSSLARSEVNASTERPLTTATPMSFQLVLTVPPSEARRLSPATGIDEVSLKITTVLPVGAPLAALRESEVGATAVGAVGRSEHATAADASNTVPSENRAAFFLIWYMEFLGLCMRIMRSPNWIRAAVVDAIRSAFDVLQSLQNAGGHRKEAEGGRGENWANCLLEFASGPTRVASLRHSP